MCGITGLSLAQPLPWAERRLAQMIESIQHRGPDSDGQLSDNRQTTWLGFRRLAIRDLDPRANQPMRSSSGRTAIVFNGEIYNTDDLAAKFLPGFSLRTTGDTEVLLEAFERHGPAIFAECNGMFAAAFLDIASGRMTLARDRMGKKPLFVFEGDECLAFGSELRTLRTFGLEPDPEQLPLYFHFGWIPAPRTFFQNTTQLRPGEFVEVVRGRIVARQTYHDFTEWAWGTRSEVKMDELESLLADAVSRRTISDVPIGVFLSGGVDSSLVASALQETGHDNLPMFTVAISDKSEAPHAAAVAQSLGLPCTALPFHAGELLDRLDAFFDCYEQPYVDSSGLPSLLLCEAVKRHVTVALSGDGGDEFFGGYRRYEWFRQALRCQEIPAFVRRWLGRVASAADRRRGLRLQRLLETRDAAGLYAALLDAWTCGGPLPLSLASRTADNPAQSLVRDLFARLPGDPLSQAACFDATYYIPDDLQVKMDRASMRVSLEVRSPLLDWRVARWGAELSPSIKFRRGLKTVLRDLLARRIPRPVFERPKQGFSIPLREWLGGPLRGMVHDALNQRCVRECGWLDPRRISEIESRFHGGHFEFATPLWSLFVLARVLARQANQRELAADRAIVLPALVKQAA